ncbi:hypothetical protein [Blastococcus brunescens]|uniref:Uncharacterized protein n=1 Tax=Blastococcus brunescens TaxID=1564165 RepID=A0ABZ1B3R8_9ACTN|nr:hypothetical protein [Blastococcus sp. BMG 8361]WRL65384.1 hypothetical protein U6N30_07045 [Blastococcus sp. BMG 8361]
MGPGRQTGEEDRREDEQSGERSLPVGEAATGPRTNAKYAPKTTTSNSVIVNVLFSMNVTRRLLDV